MRLKTQLILDGDTLVEHNQQDCEPHLNECARLRSVGAVGSGEMRHAAKLPESMVLEYMRKHGIDMNEFMVNPVHLRRMLNSPELSSFRIWQGRV